MAENDTVTDMASKDNITQRVSPETMKKIKEVGKWGESFDEVVSRLCDEHEELEKLKKKLS